eukprot:1484_1
MGNTASSAKHKSPDFIKQLSNSAGINELNVYQIDDEELLALTQVMTQNLLVIECIIDSIPEKKEKSEIQSVDFEPIFLQLKTFVTNARRQLGGQEVNSLENKEELKALKQVCLSYFDMIEFVIDSIPEQKENEIDSVHYESILLQIKTFVMSAKRQLGREEIDLQKNKEERTLKLNAALQDLPLIPFEDESVIYKRIKIEIKIMRA